jgi:outer membrane protein assembly factor BamB
MRVLAAVASLLLLAHAPDQAPAPSDTVVLKDGKKVIGRVTPLLRSVEIELKDGKRQSIDRKDIERIELESRIIHYPALKPFPNDKVRDGDFEFVSYGTVLIAVPKLPATKGYGVDLLTGATLWELDFTNHVGLPLITGAHAYLMRLDSAPSDKLKLKVGGALVAKDVHTLTVTCLDLRTGKPVWTQPFDNLDTAKELHWEYVAETIQLHLLPKHVMIFSVRRGHNVDKQGVMDKGTTRTFGAFNVYNLEKQKPEKQTVSDEAGGQVGAYVTDDLFIYLWYDGRDYYRVRAFDFRNGKQKWESEPFRGRLAGVAGKRALVRDDFNLWPLDAGNGKKVEGWQIEHFNEIASIDDEFLIQFRKSKVPRQVLVWDVTQKKPIEHAKIEMGADELLWRGRIGPLMFYSDRANTLVCYDLYEKREAWRYAGPSNGEPRHITRQGTAITFYKDGLLVQVDHANGKVTWVCPGDYLRTVQAGDVGTVGLKRGGSDLLSERTPPKDARFATPTGTPWRFLYVDDVWGRPVVIGGKIVSLSNKGRLAARDLATGAPAWEVRIAENTNNTPMPLGACGGKVIAGSGGKAFVIDPADGKTLHTFPVYAPDSAVPFLFVGENVLLCDPPGGARLIDPATGKVVWQVKEFNSAAGWSTDGRLIWVLDSAQVHEYDAATGKHGRAISMPQATNLFLIEGDNLTIANNGFRIGRVAPDTRDYAWKIDAKNQDAGITLKFGGRMAKSDGVLCWANTDGQILGLDPESGRELWKVELKPWVSPWLIHAGRLYVAAPGVGLLGIDIKTGQVPWKLELEDAGLFTPVMIGDKPAFWSSDGWLVDVKP